MSPDEVAKEGEERRDRIREKLCKFFCSLKIDDYNDHFEFYTNEEIMQKWYVVSGPSSTRYVRLDYTPHGKDENEKFHPLAYR